MPHNSRILQVTWADVLHCQVKAMVLGEALEPKPSLQEAPRGSKTDKHKHHTNPGNKDLNVSLGRSGIPMPPPHIPIAPNVHVDDAVPTRPRIPSLSIPSLMTDQLIDPEKSEPDVER